jgi:hypothetical protein
MESEGSLPHSQVPATCPYPEPARSVISLAQLMDWFSTVNLVNVGFFPSKFSTWLEDPFGRY